MSALSALVLIANGTEEMEFTIAYDTLVRAGVRCTSAFVPATSESTPDSGPLLVTCSRGVVICPDALFDTEIHAADAFNALVIPGGATGADTLSRSTSVQQLVRQFLEKKRVVGMICAGSLVALTADLPAETTLTSYPSVRPTLEKKFKYSEDAVVVDGTLVTSRGPGTAFAFALAIVELLCGREKRLGVQAAMAFHRGTPL